MNITDNFPLDKKLIYFKILNVIQIFINFNFMMDAQFPFSKKLE